MLESLGPFAALLLLALSVGLVVQFALGGALGLGRTVPATATLVTPALLLTIGGVAFASAIRDAATGIASAGDPAWVPWFAIQDRARACLPGLVGAVGATVCVLPALLGSVAKALLGVQRSPWPALLGIAVAGFIALGTVLGGVAGPGLTLAILVFCAMLTCSDARPRGLSGPLVGFGSLAMSAFSLVLIQALGLQAEVLRSLPSFEEPFRTLPSVDATAGAAATLGFAIAPWALLAICSLVPVAFLRFAGGSAPAGRDGVGVLVVSLLPILPWVYGGLQWQVLSFRAGAHSAAVAREGAPVGVPLRAPLPPRVLFVLPEGSRWFEVGETGSGSRLREEPTPADAVGRVLHLGDGVVFPPGMRMDDVYFALSDTSAGSVQWVACNAVTGEIAAATKRDPLRATGRCGASPLLLRVTRDLAHPVKVIVLRDGLVDYLGDVLPIESLRQTVKTAGEDVILRAQVDAQVSDFARALRTVHDAGRVYLGWGVSLDGDDLPIGVDPGLRVRLRSEENLTQGVAD